MRIRVGCRSVLLTVATTLALAPATLHAQFVYVANSGVDGVHQGNISVYRINSSTGALTPISGSPYTAGMGPVSVALDPSGKFTYVVNTNSDNISVYGINSSTGALTPISGSPFSTGIDPTYVTVDPSGKFTYVTNAGNNTVSGYRINSSTGALTPVSGSPFPAGLVPISVTVDPSSRFAYAANIGGYPLAGSVSAYTIDSNTGVLTPISGSPFPAGLEPVSVAVDLSGKFAYVANFFSANVSAYTIDSNTGALTPISASPFPAENLPNFVAMDPSGRFAYVTNGGFGLPGSVSAYRIDSTTGALTPISGSPFPAELSPVSLAMDPSGKFAYATNGGPFPLPGNISGYTIDSTTGALTPIAGSPFPAGISPHSVAVTGCPTPPAITGLSPAPATLWPPDHELIDVLVNYDVTAPCGEPAVCTLSVASNEPVNNDQTSPDWVVLDDHHVELRAERLGNGSGRIYTVTVRCKDARGNSATQNTAVTVAHDQGH
ncbi:MAG: beta-propeller fold lactonase family protein [Candidatus Acidiferrum sp.]|jgi:6-phosphogluconolactonase